MNRINQPSPVAVLGAGITGCCLALELARRGCRVDLLDSANEPVTGASLHNEGKLHLGFVYANDPQQRTHRLMLQGSLAFARIIERLTGSVPADFMNPQPFHYFVPQDSKLDLATIEAHFRAVEQSALELVRDSGDRYLGLSPDRYFRRNSLREHERLFSPASTLGSFGTQERSVSPFALAEIMRRTIRSQPLIRFIGNTTVQAVNRPEEGRVEVEAAAGGAGGLRRYACVVNCLWDDKLRVDRTAGIREAGQWIHRYKVAIHMAAPAVEKNRIPSATGIHGPYGDVVRHDGGRYYLSWYPLCKIEQSTQADGRALHERVHRGFLRRRIRTAAGLFPAVSDLVTSITHRRFILDNIRHMARYIPAMSGILRYASESRLGGGVILARGCSDIDDPGSQLHQRLPAGPVAHGSYVTVDTGKYTMGPLFAVRAADMVTEML